MELIKFINGSIYSVDLNRYNNTEEINRLKLTFHEEIPDKETLLTGFYLLNEYNKKIIGDYTPYTNLYLEIDSNTYVLSDTEDDVYIEPTPPIPSPDPEPVIPTLEEVKLSKIGELSSNCAATINSGVIIDIDGQMEHFSYATAEDQANIKELFDTVCGLMQKNKTLEIPIDIKLPYHSTSCKLYTGEQIINIYVSCATLKTTQTTYFNQLKQYLNSLTSIEDVKSVYYGQELTSEYLETYTLLVNQANQMIQALLS